MVQALVLAPVPDLDAAGLVKDVDHRLARHVGRAGAASQGALFLRFAVREGRLQAAGGPRRLSRGRHADGDLSALTTRCFNVAIYDNQ